MEKIFEPKWVTQALEDLRAHEQYREFAYPDPLSSLGKKYPASQWGWGFKPARAILDIIKQDPVLGSPWTVGYGAARCIDHTCTMTKEKAEERLRDDLEQAIKDAREVVASFDALDWVRKTVVVSMSYNLGKTKFKTFHGTINAINAGDYKSAALHMLNSRWARQVGNRAKVLAMRMSNGEI